MCETPSLPAVKWFSATDQSRTFPTRITCVRVDKQVHGFSYRDWASWYKLIRFMAEL